MLVLCSEPVNPSSLVRCYPIGVISMQDEGYTDDKIIAIPFGDPMYNCYRSIDQLPSHIFDEMIHFFSVYKTLEGKTTSFSDARGRAEAVEIIKESVKRYKEVFTSK